MNATIWSTVGEVLLKHWTDLLIVVLFVGFLSDGSWQRALGVGSLALLCLLIGGVVGLNYSKTVMQRWIEQQQQPQPKPAADTLTVMHDVMALQPGQAKIYRCTRIAENGMRTTIEFIAMDADDFDHILSVAHMTRNDVLEKNDG